MKNKGVRGIAGKFSLRHKSRNLLNIKYLHICPAKLQSVKMQDRPTMCMKTNSLHRTF